MIDYNIMETNNIIKHQSRIAVLTPVSHSQMPLSRGTTQVLETIRGINEVNGWEKAAEAFELECDGNH